VTVCRYMPTSGGRAETVPVRGSGPLTRLPILAVNPLGYVPSLVLDDGTLLTERPAIVQYIADKVPAKRLAPPNGTVERTKLQAWLNFFSSEISRLALRICISQVQFLNGRQG